MPLVDALFERRVKKDGTVDARSGRYILHKPAGWFDAHPKGEGDNKIFAIVRCEEAQIKQYVFEETKEVEVDKYFFNWLDPISGKPVTVAEEAVRYQGGTPVYDEPRIDGWRTKVIPVGVTAVSQKVPELRTSVKKKLDVVEFEKRKDKARIKLTPLKNIYDVTTLCVTDTTNEEQQSVTKAYDTKLNAVLTVGTGKTYATISAAITAASSGDIIQVYATTANTYSETISYASKNLQIVNCSAQVLTLTAASGNVVTLSGVGSLLFGFHIAVNNGWCLTASGYSYSARIENCVGYRLSGTTSGFNLPGMYVIVNSIAYGHSDKGFVSNGATWWGQGNCFHCGAFKNSTYGFYSNVGSIFPFLCVAAGNVTQDFCTGLPGGNTDDILCASADASADGAGSVTGFLTTDFVDYANNDFRLKASVKDTTKARFDGYPFYPLDGYNQVRKRGGVVYAGWHDPDPELTVADIIDTKTLIGAAGTYHEATTAEVKKDVTFGPASAYTGDLELPAEINVREGVGYGAAGTEYEGQIVIPSEDDVRDGVSFDVAGEGDLVLPVEANVKQAVQYGADGTEYTGVYPAAGDIPAAPEWSADPTPGNGQVTLHFTAAAPADVLYARYREVPAGDWAAESETFKRTGSGSIVITGLTNDTKRYQFSGYTKTLGLTSEWLEPLGATPTAGAKTAAGVLSLPMENLRTLLANSANFQTLVAAANAEEAKNSIHVFALDAAAGVFTRPYALITNTPDRADYRAEGAAGGAAHFFTDSGTLYLWFEADIAAADEDSHQDAGFVFQNTIGAIISDMKTLAGSGTYLAVNAFTMVNGPTRGSRKETDPEYYQAILEVRYGLD